METRVKYPSWTACSGRRPQHFHRRGVGHPGHRLRPGRQGPNVRTVGQGEGGHTDRRGGCRGGAGTNCSVIGSISCNRRCAGRSRTAGRRAPAAADALIGHGTHASGTGMAAGRRAPRIMAGSAVVRTAVWAAFSWNGRQLLEKTALVMRLPQFCGQIMRGSDVPSRRASFWAPPKICEIIRYSRYHQGRQFHPLRRNDRLNDCIGWEVMPCGTAAEAAWYSRRFQA